MAEKYILWHIFIFSINQLLVYISSLFLDINHSTLLVFEFICHKLDEITHANIMQVLFQSIIWWKYKHFYNKTAHLKSKDGNIITDRNQQMDRWVEHYLELYSTENTISEDALNNTPKFPIMEKLNTFDNFWIGLNVFSSCVICSLRRSTSSECCKLHWIES